MEPNTDIALENQLAALNRRLRQAEAALEVEVAERKRLEAALVDIRNEQAPLNEANVSGLIENTSDSIWSIGREYRIITLNSIFQTNFQLAYGAKLERGTDILACLPDEVAETWKAYYDRALSGESFGVEEKFFFDGKNFYTEIAFNPIKTAEGIIGVAVFSRNITEKKEAQIALQNSENALRTIYETAREGVIVSDPEAGVISVNPAAIKMLGYSNEEEMMGMMAKNAYVNTDQYKTIYNALIADGYIENYEAKLKTKGGGEIDVLTSAVLRQNNDGGSLQSIAFITDITERKKMENALRESEERYRVLYEKVPSMYFTVSPEGVVISVNEFGARQLGYLRDELVGQPVLKVVYEEDRKIVTEQIKGFIKNPPPIQRWQFRKIRKDGSLLWVEEFARLVSDSSGQSNILIVCQDITKHIDMQNALKESEERLSNLMEKVPEAVSVLNSEMEVVYCNNTYLELVGCTAEERLGKTPRDIWHPEDFPRARDRIKAILSGSQEFSSEYRVSRRDGAIIPVEVFSRKIIYEGKPSLLSVFRDLRERKKAELAIKKYQEHLEDLVSERTEELLHSNQKLEDEISERKSAEVKLKKSREELRHLSAHIETAREEERKWIAREIHDELGQVLSVLKMDVNWLQVNLGENQANMLDKTDAMSQLISSTIQKVRQISQKLRPDILDNLGLAAAINWQAKELQERSGIDCQIFCEDEDGIILNEELSSALFRVFQEALTNIFRHAQATKIEVRLQESDNNLNLSIRDNGIGISAEHVSNPSSFGLIGIRERIHFLNGSVEISGEAGKGTTVSVTVPIA